MMEGKSSDWLRGPSGPTVCRCCFAEGCYKDISTEYFWMGKREVYAEMLIETYDINIAYAQTSGRNSNSRLICEPCISRLRDASEFKRQVQECEKMFLQYLDPGRAVGDLETIPETLEKEVKQEQQPVKEERGQSDDDFDDRGGFDEDDDDLDDQPLTKLASKVPKKESVDLLDLLDNAKAAEKRKSTTKVKTTPAKKVKTKKDTPKATASKPKPEKKKKGMIQESLTSITLKDDEGNDIKLSLLKTPINLDDLECINEENKKNNRTKTYFKKNSVKGLNEEIANLTVFKDPIPLNDIKWNDDVNAQEDSVTFNVKTIQSTYYCRSPRKKNVRPEYKAWKENVLTIFEYSYVYPFIHASNKYKCFICSRTFLESGLLKDHTFNDHTIEDMKQALSNKIRDKDVKVDVSCLECRICSLKLADLKSLKVHLKNHGKNIDAEFKDNIIPFKLGGQTFECQVCGEMFLKLRLLIIHMSQHFNNYTCDICGSVFISLTLMKRHLQIHEQGNFPCEKCDKVFSNTAKRTIHMRGVHTKQYPRRCPMCPERFNSNYQRTKHLRIVHNQSTGLFKCETCGREYDIKYHLLLHMRSVHLQERNQECSICHARFFSKYCLSRHMVIHTGEKNFKCDVCGKAYTRRNNLREHSRTHEGSACSVCGLNCSDSETLAAHVNSCHSVVLGSS